MHLQICDAIQEVSGKDYQTELVEFERKKIKELEKYAKTSDFGCINSMHQRLMCYSNRYVSMDKGCRPLTFGIDIKPGMKEEEYSFFNQSVEINVGKRFDQT
jgi:hypothetical protein